MSLFKILALFSFVFFNYVHAAEFEVTVRRCNDSDVRYLIEETRNVAPSHEDLLPIQVSTRYYWDKLHKGLDVDFSLAHSEEKRVFAEQYKRCYSKIANPTSILSIYQAMFKLVTGKITNGYSSAFIEARVIVEQECKNTHDSEVCKTAEMMADLKNPDSELIKSIRTEIY